LIGCLSFFYVFLGGNIYVQVFVVFWVKGNCASFLLFFGGRKSVQVFIPPKKPHTLAHEYSSLDVEKYKSINQSINHKKNDTLYK
jgi:hypothetical protein